MRKFIFGTLFPVCIGALLGLFLSIFLSGCNDAGPPTFQSAVYACRMSGGLTSYDTMGGSTTSPILNHPVTLDVPAHIVSIAAQPYPFTYGLSQPIDDGTVMRWLPVGLIGGGTDGTIAPTSVVRYEYDLTPGQLRLDILEVYADGSSLHTTLTGTCTPGGV